VQVGSQALPRENLWEEKGRLMFRRKTGRAINVTHEITPSNTDVQVWVVIPSLSVNEYHTIRQNFQPGTAHRLVVTFDLPTRKFGYQLN